MHRFLPIDRPPDEAVFAVPPAFLELAYPFPRDPVSRHDDERRRHATIGMSRGRSNAARRPRTSRVSAIREIRHGAGLAGRGYTRHARSVAHRVQRPTSSSDAPLRRLQ